MVAGLDDDGDPGQTWVFRNQGSGTFAAVEDLLDVAPDFEAPQDDGPGFGRLHLWDRTGDGRADLFTAWEDVAGDGMVTVELRVATADGYDPPVTLLTPDTCASTYVGFPR